MQVTGGNKQQSEANKENDLRNSNFNQDQTPKKKNLLENTPIKE